jgi:hypothetical protein
LLLLADLTTYMNLPAVQTALHVKATSWQECGGVNYNSDMKGAWRGGAHVGGGGGRTRAGGARRRPPHALTPSATTRLAPLPHPFSISPADERTEIYPTLTQKAGYKVLIYNGDADACVPITDKCVRPAGAESASEAGGP